MSQWIWAALNPAPYSLSGFAAAMGRTNGAVESEAAANLKIAKKTFEKRRDAVGKGGKSVNTYFNNSGGAASGVGGGATNLCFREGWWYGRGHPGYVGLA